MDSTKSEWKVVYCFIFVHFSKIVFQYQIKHVGLNWIVFNDSLFIIVFNIYLIFCLTLSLSVSLYFFQNEPNGYHDPEHLYT